MRKFESVLRRESEAWEDFKMWLDELSLTETKRMVSVGASEHDLQRGVVKGIEQVKFIATATEREELARARRQG